MKIAIAGFGWWGQHMAQRLQQHPRFSVATIVEPDNSKAAMITEAGLLRFTDVSAALNDSSIDAFILTTPNTVHEEQVVQIATAGRHVFCEKPLGLSGASARRSVAACDKAGVIAGIGHERRFEPAM